MSQEGQLPQTAEGGGVSIDGGPSDNSGLYRKVEDAYYSSIDWLEQAGIPLFKVVDFLEERGVHTLPVVFLLFLLCVAGGLYWFSSLQSSSTSVFALDVYSGEAHVSGAAVRVYSGNNLVFQTQTDATGVAKFFGLPSGKLRFVVSAEGFEDSAKEFEVKLRRTGSMELMCVGGACGASFPTPLPKVSPSGSLSFMPQPTEPSVAINSIPTPDEPTLPDSVGFSVNLKDKTTGKIVPGALVELRHKLTGVLVANATANSVGSARFPSLPYGKNVYVVVKAKGFLKYNSLDEERHFVLTDELLEITVLLSPEVPEQLDYSLLQVFDDNGAPLSAVADIYLNNSADVFSTVVISPTANVSVPKGTRVTAVVYIPGDLSYGTSRVTFNSGETLVTVTLHKLVVPPSSLSSCQIILPGSGEILLEPGDRVPVTVQLSARPSTPVNVSCGGARAFSSCIGDVCFTQCVFDSLGTKFIRAVSGNVSCVSSRTVRVESGVAPSFSVALSPASIAVGATTRVVLAYANADPSAGVAVSCGDGSSPKVPTCDSVLSQCFTQCGPYSSAASRSIVVTYNSSQVASATLQVGVGPSCAVQAMPLFPFSGQPVQITVVYNYSQPISSMNIACGANVVAATCNGALSRGSCSALCSFDDDGSYAVGASSGSNPRCGTTVTVRLPPTNVTRCGDSFGTQVGSCSLSRPIYCATGGILESRASACGCPVGWRISPFDPDFCEKAPVVGVIAFNGTRPLLVNLTDGALPGATHAVVLFNQTILPLQLVGGVPVGADALAALYGGSLVSARASASGISGANSVVALLSNGSLSISPVLGGLVSAPAKSVLVSQASGPGFADVVQNGLLLGAQSLVSVAGATGGGIIFVTLGGDPYYCSDGTPSGQCTLEKPFFCNQAGQREPNALLCGCPAGWRVSQSDSSQCVPLPPALCSDGTLLGNCSLQKPLYCSDGVLEPLASICSCPQGSTRLGEQCVPQNNNCVDGAPVNSCSDYKPLYCNSQKMLVVRSSQCGCPLVNGIQFIPDGESCQPPAPVFCSDGRTRPANCKVADSPWYCSNDGSSFSSNASVCGCPVVNGVQLIALDDLCVPPSSGVCPDGVTLPGACKLDAKPLKCNADAGGYTEKASQCGCPANQMAVGDACVSCSAQGCGVTTCTGGTSVGQCAASKPIYCNEQAQLVENASSCGCQSGFVALGESCVLSGVTNCTDGSSLLSCSSSLPLYCRGDGLLESKASVCGCRPGYYVNGESCLPVSVVTHCSDGTALGACSASKPLVCNLQGILLERPSICGCPTGTYVFGDTCVPNQVINPPVCTDGTPTGNCSSSKPLFCDNGILEERAGLCNCPAGFEAVGDSCVIIFVPPQHCADGTHVLSCSSLKPLFCTAQGTLVSNATGCGCPPGKSVSGDECVCTGCSSCVDGSAINSCAITKPLYCSGDGSLAEKASSCGCPAGFVRNGESCIEQTITQCPDGTPLNSCSANKPLRCQFDGTLVEKAVQCGCPTGFHVVGEACVEDGVIPLPCADGTLSGFCSFSKPLLCEDSSLEPRAATCGCPPGFAPAGDSCVFVSTFSCSDGTPYATCLSSQPLYCSAFGVLADNATFCSCPPSFHQSGESCAPNGVNSCSDGTSLNSCSSTPPLYCNSYGLLEEKASQCNCPAGKTQSGENCVTIPPLAESCAVYAQPQTVAGGQTTSLIVAFAGFLPRPVASSVSVLCQPGVSAPVSYDSGMSAFIANCSYAQSASQSEEYFSASISFNGSAIPCSTGLSGFVTVLASPPSVCGDAAGTAVGRCVVGLKPSYCALFGSDYTGYAVALIDNSSQCGCPANYELDGDSCRALTPPNECTDGTPINACATSSLLRQPWYKCQPDPLDRYVLTLEPSASQCGCPQNRVQVGEDCLLPLGGMIDISSPAGTPKTTESIGLTATFSNFNFDVLSALSQAPPSVVCASTDQSAELPATFDVASCSPVSGQNGAVACQLSCAYPASGRGAKFVDLNFTFAQKTWNTHSQGFIVEGWPAGFCNMSAANPNIRVGQSTDVTVSFKAPFDQSGNRLPLSTYNNVLSCGTVASPQGGLVEIPPQSPISCSGNEGDCTAVCKYDASSIDLTVTSATTPTFSALEGSEFAFSCPLPQQIVFQDIAARVNVSVAYEGIPVPGATVTLSENFTGGGTQRCNSAVTDDAGRASFSYCDTDGGRRTLLLNTPVFAAAVAEVSALGNVVDLEGVSPTQVLQVAFNAGTNQLAVSIDLPPAKVDASVIDALTLDVTPELSSTLFKVSCPQIDVGVPNTFSSALRQVGSCTGFHCIVPTKASVAGCEVNASAVGYYSSVYPQETASPDPLDLSRHIVPIQAKLVPLDFPGSSFEELVSIVDVEGVSGTVGASLPLQGLSLKKGFQYLATTRLTSLKPSNQVAAFYQPSSDKRSLIFAEDNVVDKSPYYYALDSVGQLNNDMAQCSATGIDFSGPSFFEWLEVRFYNLISLQPLPPTELGFRFLPNEGVGGTTDEMGIRSFTYSSTSKPNYVLNPYDFASLDSSLGRIPYCRATMDKTPYSLSESVRSCNDGYSYCIENVFSQGGLATARGDGFIAQSAQYCDPVRNPNHCVQIIGSFKLSNTDFLKPLFDPPYTLAIGAELSRYRLEEVRLYPINNGAAAVVLRNLGDQGVTSRSNSSMTIDLSALFVPKLGGYPVPIEGEVVLVPLEPTGTGERATVQINFSSPNKNVSLSQWTLIRPRMDVSTNWGELFPLPEARQLEQLDSFSAHPERPDGFYVVSPLSLETPFEVSAWNCEGVDKGWPCTPVLVSFSALAYQDYRSAVLVFNDTLDKFKAVWVSYNITGTDGRIRVEADRVPVSSSSLKYKLGRVYSGETVQAEIALAPPLGEEQRIPVVIAFANETNPATSLNVTVLLSSVVRYGKIQLVARDALTLKPAAGTRFGLYYGGFNYYCDYTGETSCVYRLMPVAWNPSPACAYSEGMAGSGCVNVSVVPPGYFGFLPIELGLSQLDSGGALFGGSIEAGKTKLVSANLQREPFPVGCVDGTLKSQCSASKPNYCNSEGLLTERPDLCGCPTGKLVCGGDSAMYCAESCPGISCSDGTAAGSCSASKPLFCDNGVPEPRASVCGCPQDFAARGEQCVGVNCADGTSLEYCSVNKPLYCDIQGLLVEEPVQCGCPQGMRPEGGSCVVVPTCTDGTPYGECSSEKPKFCNAGALVSDPEYCGCQVGMNFCRGSSGGYCAAECPVTSCSDGTILSSCSVNKPWYCNAAGALVSSPVSPVVCGCPSGEQVCGGADGSYCAGVCPGSPCGSVLSGSCKPGDQPLFCVDGSLELRASVCNCPAGFVAVGEVCEPVVTPVACSDGTALGLCSDNPPWYCNAAGALVSSPVSPVVCGCPSGEQVCGGADGSYCAGVCPGSPCGSLISGSCKADGQPLFCEDGSLVPRAGVCGCPAGFEALGDSCVPIVPPSPCSDGTVSGACSVSKPSFCSAGQLVPRAHVCGCPGGIIPNGDICGCDAGTIFGQCSTDLPNLCGNDGVFVPDPQVCGCPLNENICTAPDGSHFCSTSCSAIVCPEGFIEVDGVCKELSCSDGTTYGVCSTNQPFLCDSGRLVEAPLQCGCASGLNLCSGSYCAVSCSLGTCSDGTPFGACSESQPMLCVGSSSGGVLEQRAYTCGCPAGFTENGDECVCASGLCPACSDGTALNSCSSSQPYYCDADASLVEDPVQCGCSGSLQVCGSSNGKYCAASCTGLSCQDGTVTGFCSSDKPLFCENGVFDVRASVCGCATGFETMGEQCVLIPVCSDNTPSGSCSQQASMLCDNGVLESRASVCGCGEGFAAYGDICLPINSAVQIQAITLVDNSGAEVCTFSRFATSLADCIAGQVILKKGTPYRAKVQGLMSNGHWGGLYFAVGGNTVEAKITGVSGSLVGAGGSRPVLAIAASPQNSSCSSFERLSAFVPLSEPGSASIASHPLLDDGASWVELLADASSQAGPRGTAPFTSEFNFIVLGEYAKDSIGLSFGAFLSNVTPTGEVFLRDPPDDSYGYAWSTVNKAWCEANALTISAQVSSPSTGCSNPGCVTISVSQRESVAPSPPDGFEVLSSNTWSTFSSEPYPPIKMGFSIDLRSSPAGGSFKLVSPGGNIQATAVRFTKFCGLPPSQFPVLDLQGALCPRLVLKIISYLNAHTSLPFCGTPGYDSAIDVNGDGMLSPPDVLIAINAANSRLSGDWCRQMWERPSFNECGKAVWVPFGETVFGTDACVDVLGQNNWFSQSNDIEGEFDLTAFAESPRSDIGLSLSNPIGETKFDTWLKVINSADLNYSNYAIVSSSVYQSKPGFTPNSAECSPFTRSCSAANFVSTFGAEGCNDLGVDNAFQYPALARTPRCHAGWLEFKYGITSKVNAPDSSASFQLLYGDAVLPQIPSAEISTPLALFTITKTLADGSQDVITADVNDYLLFDVNTFAKYLNVSIGAMNIGDTAEIVVRVNPKSSGLLSAILRFNNGDETVLKQNFVIGGSKVQTTVCPGPSCPDILALHPCGKGQLDFSASSQTQTSIVPSCLNTTLVVDPIFPADAIPLKVSGDFKAVCSGGNDPFKSGLFKFEKIAASEIPKGSRALDPTDLDLTALENGLLAFNGAGFGTNRDRKITRGNNIVWPDEPARPYAPGEEIGRINLVMQCSNTPSKVTILVKLVSGYLSSSAGLNAIPAVDASTAMYSRDPRRLGWALYNGQFPEQLVVQAANEPRTVALAFNPKDRVKYFTLNPFESKRTAGSYPLQVYSASSQPATQAVSGCIKCGNICVASTAGLSSCTYSTESFACNLVAGVCIKQITGKPAQPLPLAANSTSVKAAGGVTLVQSDGLRPGSTEAQLIGRAYQLPELQSFGFGSNGAATTNNTCSLLNYRSTAYATIPSLFKSFAREVGVSTAFRRTKRPDDVVACAYAKKNPPFYCDSSLNVIPNAEACGCPSGFSKDEIAPAPSRSCGSLGCIAFEVFQQEKPVPKVGGKYVVISKAEWEAQTSEPYPPIAVLLTADVAGLNNPAAEFLVNGAAYAVNITNRSVFLHYATFGRGHEVEDSEYYFDARRMWTVVFSSSVERITARVELEASGSSDVVSSFSVTNFNGQMLQSKAYITLSPVSPQVLLASRQTGCKPAPGYELVGLCADGTHRSTCSQAVPSYYCTDTLRLVLDKAKCGNPPAPKASVCFDGTPPQSCLFQNAGGVYSCKADTDSWKAFNFESVINQTDCLACVGVQAFYSERYAYDSAISVRAYTSVASDSELFPVLNPVAVKLLGNKVKIAADLVLPQGGFNATPATAVLEFQRDGSSCSTSQVDNPQDVWCSTGLFGASSNLSLPFVGVEQGAQTRTLHFEREFDVPSGVSYDGSWIVRSRVAYSQEGTGLSKDLKSAHSQLVVVRMAVACIDDNPNETVGTPYTCLAEQAAGSCNSACVDGKTFVETSAGLGAATGEEFLWLNATPIEAKLLGTIPGLDSNAGMPFASFFNTNSRNFTYSFPLMMWSSSIIDEWKTASAFEGYKSETSTCSEGIGFYELRAESANGTSDWDYFYRLKTLPLPNNLLNTEPNDAGNFDASLPASFLKGTSSANSRGCQLHTEAPSFDWSRQSVASRPVVLAPDLAQGGGPYSPLHDKPLCNINLPTVWSHTSSGNGAYDCVSYNSQRFGGNCGCALPGCIAGLPVCKDGSGNPVNDVRVCPLAECVATGSKTASKACACAYRSSPGSASTSSSYITNAAFVQMMQGLGINSKYGYYSSTVTPGTNATYCPRECTLVRDKTTAIIAGCSCSSSYSNAHPEMNCSGKLPGSKNLLCGFFKQNAGGAVACNPGYCTLSAQSGGCAIGSALTLYAPGTTDQTVVIPPSGPASCADGTAIGACSSSRPSYCNLSAQLIDRASSCKCPAGKVVSGESCVLLSSCSDGTSVNSCSSSKPSFCNSAGSLVDKASQCNCPAGKVVSGESCVLLSSCSDGTSVNSCSLSKPSFCNSAGLLVDKASQCNCPAGKVVSGESCVLPDFSNSLVMSLHLEGDAIDSSPNHFVNTAKGRTVQAMTVANCKVGSCLNFDGTSDYIESSTDLGFLKFPFTFSVWFNADSTQVPYADILGNSGSSFTGFVLQKDSGTAPNNFGFGYGTGSNWASGPAFLTFTSGAWHHFVGVLNGTHCLSYINGVQVMAGPSCSQPIAMTPSVKFKVGHGYSPSSRVFKGKIDEVHIWNRTLSDNEVLALYSLENAGTSVGPNTPTVGTCSDGTAFNSCSLSKPSFCNSAGLLVDKASQCNCPAGKVVSGESCVVAATTCSDGTAFNVCSLSKPSWCSPAGLLADWASLCGCPAGKVVSGDSCIVPGSSVSQAITCVFDNSRLPQTCSIFYPAGSNGPGTNAVLPASCFAVGSCTVVVDRSLVSQYSEFTARAGSNFVMGTYGWTPAGISSQDAFYVPADGVNRTLYFNMDYNGINYASVSSPSRQASQNVTCFTDGNDPLATCSAEILSGPNKHKYFHLGRCNTGACTFTISGLKDTRLQWVQWRLAATGEAAFGGPSSVVPDGEECLAKNTTLLDGKNAQVYFFCSRTPTKCTDGTLVGSCSASKQYCTSSGVLGYRASTCGCGEGLVVKGEDCVLQGNFCPDGTAIGSCSAIKPFYCSNESVLSPAASKCSCPSGFNAVGESCKPSSGSACSDGTRANTCSLTKPFFCDAQGFLSVSASRCGCTSGYSRQGDSCFPSIIVSLDKAGYSVGETVFASASAMARFGVIRAALGPPEYSAMNWGLERFENGAWSVYPQGYDDAFFSFLSGVTPSRGAQAVCMQTTMDSVYSFPLSKWGQLPSGKYRAYLAYGCALGTVPSQGSVSKVFDNRAYSAEFTVAGKPCSATNSCASCVSANGNVTLTNADGTWSVYSNLCEDISAAQSSCVAGTNSGNACYVLARQSQYSCVNGNVVNTLTACPEDSLCTVNVETGAPFCKTIGCNCPVSYEPVCGADENTYGNSCAAACLGVPVSYNGACSVGGCFITQARLLPGAGIILLNRSVNMVLGAPFGVTFITGLEVHDGAGKLFAATDSSMLTRIPKSLYAVNTSVLEKARYNYGRPMFLETYVKYCPNVLTDCSDGTRAGTCSYNKPSFCKASGTLSEKASWCGCFAGMKASGDSCVVLTCSDGTALNKCAASKPLYCNSTGVLVQKAPICGCSPGYSVTGDFCV